MAFQNPVIVIPGIMGSSLQDSYPMNAQDVWSTVLKKEYERVSMHPDNFRYEAIEPARIFANGILGVAYDDLVSALRHELAIKSDKPTPVFAFPYDWRQDLKYIGEQLGGFINEVLERTKLLRHYKGWTTPRVDVVAHSMGGLVLVEYLSLATRRQVGKVATLATPYLGSLEAVAKLVTGMGSLSGSTPSERERETARSMQSVYQLLPSFANAIRAQPGSGLGNNLFEAATWQPSIVNSLAEYVRIHSVNASTAANNRSAAEQLFKDFLKGAKDHRAKVNTLKLDGNTVPEDDWMAVVGVHVRTRVEMEIRKANGAPRFFIDDKQYVDEYEKDPTSRRTGDGTVPLEGALPPFLPEDKIIALTPQHFSWTEFQDRILAAREGLHALLPTMNLAQRLVIKHFHPGFKGEVKGRRVPGSMNWNPPLSGLLEG